MTKTPSTLSSFFQAKVAFEIPAHYGRDGIYGTKYDDQLVSLLMGLFEDTEFEGESLCAPAMLIVGTHEVPTEKWIEIALTRINGVLRETK